jgi:SPP1 family predicted phage head-tail adaptor
VTAFSIGALRHRLVLETPVRSSDGGGGATVTWSPVAEVWAQIIAVGGKETVVAEALAGRVSHEIVIRYRAGVVPAMRLRWGGRIFEILAVFDPEERGRVLHCHCREELL